MAHLSRLKKIDVVGRKCALFAYVKGCEIMAKKRKKISQRKAKKLFSKTADKTRAMNLRAVPMRGGFRI